MREFHDRIFEQMIRERIRQDERLVGEAIRIEASDGIIRLIGRAKTQKWNEEAEQIVGSMLGVHGVENLIEVW